MATKPIETRPIRDTGREVIFDYFKVEDTNGNPFQKIEYKGQFYTLRGWNSNTLEVTYVPVQQE